MKYMGIRKFVDEGYLQEVNRQFFHPLGLALATGWEEDASAAGYYGITGVQDFRDDNDEGVIFTDGVLNKQRRDNINAEFAKREVVRLKTFGFVIQPIEED